VGKSSYRSRTSQVHGDTSRLWPTNLPTLRLTLSNPEYARLMETGFEAVEQLLRLTRQQLKDPAGTARMSEAQERLERLRELVEERHWR